MLRRSVAVVPREPPASTFTTLPASSRVSFTNPRLVIESSNSSDAPLALRTGVTVALRPAFVNSSCPSMSSRILTGNVAVVRAWLSARL